MKEHERAPRRRVASYECGKCGRDVEVVGGRTNEAMIEHVAECPGVKRRRLEAVKS